MKKVPLVLLLVCNLSNLFSLSPGDKYWSSTDWEGQDGSGKILISGQVNTTVTIEVVSSESLVIHIFKEMTPFGQVVDFDATAFLKDGQYEFSGMDNWENMAFGHLRENGDSVEFLLDCVEFGEDGKDLGRLYGDQYELAKMPY